MAPLHKPQLETMNDTINDKQSTEDGGAVDKPAVLGSFTLVSDKEPPKGRELLVRSDSGVYHLTHWRPAYRIFTCQNKGEDTWGWSWIAL
jgi:hypothetical protein